MSISCQSITLNRRSVDYFASEIILVGYNQEYNKRNNYSLDCKTEEDKGNPWHIYSVCGSSIF